MRGAKQTEMFEILRRREILQLWSVCPPGVCVGGGGTLIFSYILWPGLFLGFKILNFNIFGGFRKLNIFWYEDFADIFWIITKLDYQGTDWRIFFGLLGCSNFKYLLGCFKCLNFFFGGGGGGTVDAGPEPTYEEK